jgi:CheY-like chemotaxis protein
VIFLVDEDMSAFTGWIADLEIRGYEVGALWDADEAYSALSEIAPEEVDLVVVDVMLAVSPEGTAGLTAEATEDYLLTGLRLVELLAAKNPAVFPARAVFLTNVVNEDRLTLLRSAAEDMKIELWRKHRISGAIEFGDLVVQRIESLRAEAS